MDIKKTIQEIRELKEDWNSYGAPTINGDICDYIERLIPAMVERGLPEPDYVVPCPGGGISFCFRENDREILVEVNPDDGEQGQSLWISGNISLKDNGIENAINFFRASHAK
jgi:hypothetical protein